MLLTPRLFVLDPDTQEQTVLAKGALPAQGVCVVARGACGFRRTRLMGEGRNALKAAQLKAEKEALPGEDGAIIVADKGQEVAALTAAPMAGLWSFAKDSRHKGRYLPESLAQQPLENGARLVSGLSGYEGQIWVDKNLVASRWWPMRPTPAQWDIFIRAAQETLGPLAMPLPSPQTVPWRKDIAPFALDQDQLEHWLSPRNIGGLVATGLLCGFLYLGGQYTREILALQKAEAKVADLSTETELILSQRRRALANMRYVGRYSELGGNTAVLDAMGALASVLGSTDLAVQRFSLRQNQIDARLMGETEVSVPDVVSLLESDAALSNVSVSLDAAGAVIVRADLGDAAPTEAR